jgi:hypothetical protein
VTIVENKGENQQQEITDGMKHVLLSAKDLKYPEGVSRQLI